MLTIFIKLNVRQSKVIKTHVVMYLYEYMQFMLFWFHFLYEYMQFMLFWFHFLHRVDCSKSLVEF